MTVGTAVPHFCPQHQKQQKGEMHRRQDDSSVRTRSLNSRPTTTRSSPCGMLAYALTFALLLAHVVEANQGGDDAPFQVKAIKGGSVNLPCDVDLTSCGDVHSIKVYKNGVRVFLLNLHTDYEKAEGDLASPNKRADFVLDNTPPVLNVDPVVLLDEGLYKCEATFLRVSEDCRSIAYASLTTLARPSPPEIRYDDGPMSNMTRIGPFIEGTKLTLECRATGGKPVALVSWYNGTDPMDSQYSEIPDAEQTARGVSTVDVTLDRADLHSRFECRAMNDALDKPLITWIDVDVHVRPLSIDILGVTGPVREGDQVTLVCVVMGARPAATIEWLNDTVEVNPPPPTEVTEEDAGFTSTTRSPYTFMASRFDNGRKFRCRATNSIMEERKEEPKEHVLILEVYYRPQVVMVPEGKMAVNHTEAVELECQYDANPMNLTSVVWLRNREPIARTKAKEDDDEDDGDAFRRGDDDSDDDLDDELDDDDDDDDVDEVPRLILQSVSHKHAGEYTCKLTNDVGFGFSSTSLVLDVYYPPVMEIEITPESVPERDNANVTLECNLITSNPSELFGYVWLRDGEVIEETEDDTYVLYDVDRNDTANYSCQARNIYGLGKPSEEEELIVQYPPGPSYITFTPPIVIKGHSVTITCNTDDLGLPPAHQYRWFRNEIMQATATGPTMVIKHATLAALSNFTCKPFNIIGEGPEAQVNIPLGAAPSFVQQLPETHGVVYPTRISLTCHVECFPLCAPITWERDGKTLKSSSKTYSFQEVIEPLNYHTNTMDSVVSTLSWNLTEWQDGRPHRDSNNANYTCKSGSNLFGHAVNSTTHFRVEYPPEDITLTYDVVDVKVGEIARKVVCKVNAHPQPTFVWTFGDEIVSGTDTLRLKHKITKEDAGNYTCMAENPHGSANATTVINVKYIDEECHIEKTLTQDGRVVVTCSVDANPSDVDFEWFFENSTLNDDHDIDDDDDLSSRVIFHEETGFFGEYQCVANNSVGRTDPCIIEVTGEGGWLEKLDQNKGVFVTAAVVAVLMLILLITIIVCIVKRLVKGKEMPKTQLEERQNPEGVQTDTSQALRPTGTTVVTFKKRDVLSSLRRPKRRAQAGTDGEGREDGDRAFYENLPFHGMQPPPNKQSKQRPTPAPRKTSPRNPKPVYQNISFPKITQQPVPSGDKPFKPILPDLEYADVDFPAKPLNNNNPPYNTKAKIVERVLEEVKDESSPEKVPPTRPPRSKEARK